MTRHRHLTAVGAALAFAFVVAAPAEPRPLRDDTAWLQARLDAGGGRILLPRLPGGECYATRGLWVSRDDTEITSNGACIQSLGPGGARMQTVDGDAVTANAVFYVNRVNVLEPAPVRVRIRGLRIVVPRGANTFGLGLFGHDLTVEDVTVSGSPIDAVTIGPRGNGDGYAGPVTLRRCRLSGGMRNLVSATGVIGLRIERCRISGASDTYPTGPGRFQGNPAAGIDIEPDSRGTPILDVRIARNVISDNAGPGVLLAFSTNRGFPVHSNRIEIVRNRILGNGRKATPPFHGGIAFRGGQDRGGTRVLVADNVIRANRGAGLHGYETRLVVDARRNDLRGNQAGPTAGVRLVRRGR
jgi:Right handed beta helix region